MQRKALEFTHMDELVDMPQYDVSVAPPGDRIAPEFFGYHFRDHSPTKRRYV